MSAGPHKGTTEPIGQLQYFLFVAVSVVAGGVYVWPALILQDAGTAAMLTVLLSIGMALISTWVKAAWQGYLGSQSYADLLESTMGLVIGRMVLVLLGLLYVASFAVLVSLYSQTLSTFFYPTTPHWVLTVVLIVVGAYIATKELHVVARTVQLWFPFVIAGVTVLVALGLRNAQFWDAAIPPSRIDTASVLKGAVTMWYLWMQGQITATVGPHVRGADKRRLRALALWAIIAQGVILVMLYATVVATVGPEAGARLQFPLVYVFSNILVTASFIPRIGLFILFTWTAALVLNLAVHLFGLSWNVNLMFRRGTGSRPIIVAVISLCIFIGANALPEPHEATQIIRMLLSPGALVLEALPEILIVVWLALRHALRNRRTGALRTPT